LFLQESVIVLTGVAVYRKWDLAVLSFLLLPFITYGTRVLSEYVKRRRKKVQRSLARLTHRMNETAVGIKVIKVSPMNEHWSENLLNIARAIAGKE